MMSETQVSSGNLQLIYDRKSVRLSNNSQIYPKTIRSGFYLCLVTVKINVRALLKVLLEFMEAGYLYLMLLMGSNLSEVLEPLHEKLK